MDCYCDNPAEFLTTKIRRARKSHRCEECGCKIQPGETYEHITGKWEGCLSTIKTCSACREIRDWVVGNVPCACWEYGNMMEGLWESISQAVYRAPDETKGLTFGFLRRRHAYVHRNRATRKAAMQ